MATTPLRILLLGPHGQVGWELRRALAPLGELTALARTPDGLGRRADLLAPDALAEQVRSLRADVIVNAAAYTAVDRAEDEPELAQCVNAQAPAVLAAVAAEQGGWLVHYSTDYVFDGSGETPWAEDAPARPLSVYGRSKWDGDRAITDSGCRHLILRTSWVHAARGGNFARTMLRLAAQRDTLRVVDDQIGAPTGAELIADVTAHALRRALVQPTLSGTYHLAAGGHTSWCGYARHVLAWAQARGLPLRAAPETVEPVPSSAYVTRATRPLNSRLDTRKLRAAFGLHLPAWQLGVDRVLDELPADVLPSVAAS